MENKRLQSMEIENRVVDYGIRVGALTSGHPKRKERAAKC
jgi:hypothetical protein